MKRMARFLVLSSLLLYVELVMSHGNHQSNSNGASSSDPMSALAAHNKLRSAVKALSMYKLNWDEKLAVSAARHAERCKNAPSDPDQRKNIGRFARVGENYLFTPSTKSPNFSKVIKKWASEQKYFDVRTQACEADRQCGNYTQMVWSTTDSVGCAAAKCSTIDQNGKSKAGQLIVCHYGPEGNRKGEQPFVKASTSDAVCSKCPEGSACAPKDRLCSRAENSEILPEEPSKVEVILPTTPDGSEDTVQVEFVDSAETNTEE